MFDDVLQAFTWLEERTTPQEETETTDGVDEDMEAKAPVVEEEAAAMEAIEAC